jgi:hypothetical protein
MKHWNSITTVMPKCRNQECDNDVLPMSFGTEVRMQLVCNMECMTKVEDQNKLNAKDDQLFSESFESSIRWINRQITTNNQ